MNPALLLLLLFDGDGEADTSQHGFLCVRSISITPTLVCRISNAAALSATITNGPALTGKIEVDTCQ